MKSFTDSCELLKAAYDNYTLECKSESPGFFGRRREKEFLPLKNAYETASEDKRIFALIHLGLFIIKQSDGSRLKRHLINAFFDIFCLPAPEIKLNKKIASDDGMRKYGSGFMYALAFSSRQERHLAIESQYKVDSEKAMYLKKKEMVEKCIASLNNIHNVFNSKDKDYILPPDLIKIVGEYAVGQENKDQEKEENAFTPDLINIIMEYAEGNDEEEDELLSFFSCNTRHSVR